MTCAGERWPDEGSLPDSIRARWVLLWDGECGLCRRSVRWVLARDRRGLLLAMPYQDALAWLPQPVRERSPRQAHLRAPDGRYWGGGAAVIRLAGLLGHPLLERVLSLPGPRHAVGWAYRWVAAHRSALAPWV